MRRKKYLEGYRGMILAPTLENGFFPRDAIHLFKPVEESMLRRTIKTLKDEGVLEENKTIGGIRYLRLTDEGEDKVLSEANAELKDSYNNPSTKYSLRCLGMKKPEKDKEKEITYRTSQNKIVNDVCSKLFANVSGVETEKAPLLEVDAITKNDSYYYTSSEVKNSGSYKITQTKGIGAQKIANSRINGLSITPGGVYAMYSTGKYTPEWKRTGELKMATCIQSLASKAIKEMSIGDYQKEAVIISKKDSNFVKVVKADSQKENSKRRTLMNIDFAYDHMYAIPYSYDGVRMFGLMQKPLWKAKIKEQMLTRDEIYESDFVSVACDGYNKKDGVYKLIFCIPDMVKLKAFATRAAIDEEKERYHVYCYKSQLSVIAPILKGYAKVFVIDLGDMERELDENRVECG